MKLRDFVFVVALLVVAGLVVSSNGTPAQPHRGFVDRVTRFVAAWWLFGDAPAAEAQYEQLPPAIANQEEPRDVSSDGIASLRHGSGW